MSHRRYNPLLGEWVLCSAERLDRPWRGEESSPPPEEVPSFDPDCYMCPGNRRARGERNPDYDGVFLFDNDYPALSEREDLPRTSALLVAETQPGRCRVLCFSPRHDLDLGRMSRDAVRDVVDAWAEEGERLHRERAAGYVQIFENRGAMMGASNPHPHGQIWASERVPTMPARKAERQARYWSRHGTDLLGDYLDEEIHRSERIVDENEHWVQLVPFWAAWPFETMVVPRRHVGALGELDDDERTKLAELIGRLTRRYDTLFQTAFPYSMGWYQRPRDGDVHDGSRLHAVYLPPLVRSARVRKYVVGYELTSEPQRDFAPEEAAAMLRASAHARRQDRRE